MMGKKFFKLLTLLGLGPTAIFFIWGCGNPSNHPGEQAGKKTDETAKALKDAVTPKGPAEKAGKNIDDATNSLKKAASRNDTTKKSEN